MSILNNVLSGGYWFNQWDHISGAGNIAVFDYNLMAPHGPASAADWWGVNNLTNALAVWATNSVPTFILPAGSPAIDAGQNLPVVYPALPQDSTVLRGAAWDMGALESGTPITVRNLRIGKP